MASSIFEISDFLKIMIFAIFESWFRDLEGLACCKPDKPITLLLERVLKFPKNKKLSKSDHASRRYRRLKIIVSRNLKNRKIFHFRRSRPEWNWEFHTLSALGLFRGILRRPSGGPAGPSDDFVRWSYGFLLSLISLVFFPHFLPGSDFPSLPFADFPLILGAAGFLKD